MPYLQQLDPQRVELVKAEFGSFSDAKVRRGKNDALRVELLQKPVSGQPQMVQLVPGSKLDAGVYSLFAVRMQGGQPFVVNQLFQLKGPSASEPPIASTSQ